MGPTAEPMSWNHKAVKGVRAENLGMKKHHNLGISVDMSYGVLRCNDYEYKYE